MYLILTLPILIANLIFSSIAFYDIWYHYEFSTFKPRLIMVVTLIFSNIPMSLAYVFTDIFNNGFLMNNTYCYIYVLIANFYMLKFFALLALTVFIGLIIFTKYNVARLNKIGWWLNLVVLSLFLFYESVLILISGWTQTDFDTDLNNCKRPKRCVVDSALYSFSGFLSVACTIITIIAAVVFLIENFNTKKLKKGTSSYRISSSFFFFAIVNLVASTEWFIGKIRGKQLDGPAKWIALDIGKIVPALFSIVYLITEAWGRLAHVSFGIKRILKVTKCRRLFKNYLSDIDSKKFYELVSKWEKLNLGGVETIDVLDRPGLSKEEANAYIEKHLDLELYGFLTTEAFNDFNLTYNFGGQIEANLAEEVELQNVNKVSNAQL